MSIRNRIGESFIKRFFLSLSGGGVIGIFLLFHSTVYSQVSDVSFADTMHHLHAVEVRAKRMRIGSEGIVTPMQTLQGVDLERLHPIQVSDVVRQFSGVNVKDYGGIGGMKTVSVRSLGAAHTAVSYDGVLLSDAQNGQIDLGKIFLDGIKSISLHNGQSGTIFAPARNFSAASLIELKTYSLADFDSLEPWSASFTYGSFLSVSPSLVFRKKIRDDLAISVMGRYDYVRGDYPFWVDLGGDRQKLRRDNSDVMSGNAMVNLNWQASSRHRLDWNLSYFGSERGLPGAVIYYYKASAQRLEDQNFWTSLKHTWQLNSWITQRNLFKYNFAYSRFTDPESLSSQTVDERYLQQEAYVSTSTLFRTPVDGLSFSSSFDAAFNFLASNVPEMPSPWRTSLWLNVAGRYSHTYFEIVANALGSAFLDRVSSGKQPEDKFRISPFVSLAAFPLGNRSLSVRMYFKDIFRVPTFNDLYYGRIGNVSLRPEKAKQLDLGITYMLPMHTPCGWQLEVNVDAYRNWVQDKIVAYPTTNLFVWSMMNVDKVEITGLDVSLRTGSRFAERGMGARFYWQVQATYTLQDALDKTDPEGQTYNHQVAYTPRHSGSSTWILGLPYVDLTYRLVFSGRRYSLNQNLEENSLSPYMEHSLGLVFKIGVKGTHWELGADWLNFMGEAYEVVKNYPMPLANYRVHLRCRF